MNTITPPIKFTNIAAMNKCYGDFEKEALEICRKYNTANVWETAKILKDEKSLQFAIVSLSPYVKGSNEEKAVKEILIAFKSIKPLN
jgi:hypothetical protein